MRQETYWSQDRTLYRMPLSTLLYHSVLIVCLFKYIYLRWQRSYMSVLSWIHLDLRLNGTRTLHFLWTIWCHKLSLNYHDMNLSCPCNIQHGAAVLTKKMPSPNNNGNIHFVSKIWKNQLVVSVWGNFSWWCASPVCQTWLELWFHLFAVGLLWQIIVILWNAGC